MWSAAPVTTPPARRDDAADRPRRRVDVLAGVGVLAVLLPQSLAYAELAGLPAGRGLPTAAAAGLLAALLGSAVHLQTGPTALASLLTLGALGGLAGGDEARAVALASLLAVLVGLFRLVLGLVGGGRLASLLSRPVLVGLTMGAGTLIVVSQVPGMAGVSARGGNPLLGLLDVVGGDVSWWSLAVGLAALATMLVLPRVAPRAPAAIVALLVGALVATFAPADAVARISMDAGALGIDVGPLAWSDVANLLLPAAVLAVIGFSEVAAIARRYATADRTAWDADRELRAQGVACAAAGLAGGFPVSGSFGRSALLRLAGARTRLAAIVTGVLVLVALPVADLLPSLPRPALGAVVVAAGLSLMDLGGLRLLARIARLQFGVASGTLAATIVLAPRIDLAVLVGIGLAVAAHLFREERLHLQVTEDGDTLHLAVQGVLFFVSVPRMSAQAARAVAGSAAIRRIVVDLGGAGRVDASGALALADLVEEWQEAGLIVEVHDVPTPAQRIVGRVVSPRLGEGD